MSLIALYRNSHYSDFFIDKMCVDRSWLQPGCAEAFMCMW